MSRLPIIVGFGGYNAAGRSSFNHGFRRMVIESLDIKLRQDTLVNLAIMMKLIKFDRNNYFSDGKFMSIADIENKYKKTILSSTLIRRIEPQYFDPNSVHWHKNVQINTNNKQFTFKIFKKFLPTPLPNNWSIKNELTNDECIINIDGIFECKMDSYRALSVKSAGQLPTGFNPSELYNAHYHPRGVQMAILAASDAIRSMGISWNTVLKNVGPDEIAVFSGSIMSQLDDNGFGGLLKSRLKGHRVSAKQLPMGLNSMPTDFINSYVLGNIGMTGSTTGACATFLYNLHKAIDLITTGKARVVIVGNSEAPILPECIEGYSAMGALATEEGLRNIAENKEDNVDYSRASRPFGENCGFTLAESSQYIILMDDELTIALGADIYGATTDVFINADGFKKSISSPGPGNYVTMAKAVASAVEIFGLQSVRNRSFIHAHGSSTPTNRITESAIFDNIASIFGIKMWPISAVKAFVGHSLSTASADQLICALGTFQYGILPGIKTIDKVADDVHKRYLKFFTKDIYLKDKLDICFINSKGFGGNNASGVLISPQLVEKMVAKRQGKKNFSIYCKKRETIRAIASQYDEQARIGKFGILYNFGKNLINETDIKLNTKYINIPGFHNPLFFKKDDRFRDML